jgi:divalent metal cation (Fe/Co/Zn/Cd) transporter
VLGPTSPRPHRHWNQVDRDVTLARLNDMARTPVTTLLGRALRLEYFTIVVVSAEAIGALASGIAAGSVALEAFGVDSLIELVSAVIVLGEARVLASGATPDPRRRHRDHRALSVLFYALIVYVVTAFIVALARHQHAHENVAGVVVCVASLLAMVTLAKLKWRTASRLGQSEYRSLARLVNADAAETIICGVLSLSTLLGIALAGSLGWWWADPVASLAVVAIAAREGREAWNCEPQ